MRKKDTVCYNTMPDGLRCVHIHMPGAPVGYFGVAIHAGSRDEVIAAGEAGLAHFVEHTIFKGTEKRSSWHIINRMESVGGELNAFTTKEDTVVYTAFARGNLGRAMELVADLICHSRFPDNEIEREREVVADEIASYLDQPSEAVFDDFEDLVFEGTSLGHNILGTKETVARFTGADCRDWIRRHYLPQRMTAFYAGATSSDSFFRMSEKYLSGISAASAPVTEKKQIIPARRFDVRRSIESHQDHVVMGVVLPAMDMRQRAVAALVTNILGGPGMNSLLNVVLRERRGLVYNVEASTTMFTDCGEFTVYFGCDPQDTVRCRNLVSRQIAGLAEHCMTERRLAAAKKQYLGQMTIADDNRENRAIAIARATLLRGRALTPEELIDCIRSVSAEDIRRMSEVLTDLSTLVLGPAS
ncbi:MAG: pitrilysin family protein [Bacteroidales bacterium]|nr:pitrilysin family protein [Bacteroidales bacterium]